MSFSTSKATRAVRASIESDTQHGAVVPPLHLSSNYAFAGLGEPRQYDYTRSGNRRAMRLAMRWPSLREAPVQSLRHRVWAL